MCSNLPIIRLIPLEKYNCAILYTYGACVDSYIYGILYGMRVVSTEKNYHHGIPYMVYSVSNGNHFSLTFKMSRKRNRFVL